MFTRRSTSLLLACVLVAVALSACGSSSKSSSSTAAATPTTASTASTATPSTTASTAPSGSSIKVGMVCSCSGAQASILAGMSNVSKAWASSVNASGGINGHPVQMFTLDDGGVPATALQDAKQLVQQDHVIAIVGEVSLADAAFASYVAKAGVPVVGGISPEASFISNPDFYPSGTQLVTETVGTIALAKAAGKSNVGVLYCAESPICAELVPLAQGAGKLSGLKITPAKISATAPSYSAPCLAQKSAGVDSEFIADNAAIAIRFAAACAQEGFKPEQVTQFDATSNAMLTDSQFNGAPLAGVNANPYDASTPAVAQFQAALNKYDPGYYGGSSFAYDAILPWAGGQLFEAAAKAADIGPTSTSADVKKGLYALKNETLGGLSSPLNFTAGAPAFVPCYFTGEISGGKYVSTNGNKPTCFTAAQAKALEESLKQSGA